MAKAKTKKRRPSPARPGKVAASTKDKKREALIRWAKSKAFANRFPEVLEEARQVAAQGGNFNAVLIAKAESISDRDTTAAGISVEALLKLPDDKFQRTNEMLRLEGEARKLPEGPKRWATFAVLRLTHLRLFDAAMKTAKQIRPLQKARDRLVAESYVFPGDDDRELLEAWRNSNFAGTRPKVADPRLKRKVERFTFLRDHARGGGKLAAANVKSNGKAKRTAVYLDNRRYKVGDAAPLVLQESEDFVLRSLIELGGAASLSELRKQTGKDDCATVLRKIKHKAKYRQLAAFIKLPGGKGKGGYRTTIRKASVPVR